MEEETRKQRLYAKIVLPPEVQGKVGYCSTQKA